MSYSLRFVFFVDDWGCIIKDQIGRIHTCFPLSPHSIDTNEVLDDRYLEFSPCHTLSLQVGEPEPVRKVYDYTKCQKDAKIAPREPIKTACKQEVEEDANRGKYGDPGHLVVTPARSIVLRHKAKSDENDN